jgi:UDP-glucuronate decarboxylase
MRLDDGRVVSNFLVQAIKGDPITIYGDGSQTRSFCFVDDLIEGLIGVMNSNDDVTGPINLGNPTEFSMIELAKLVIEITNSDSKIINLDLPADDPKQRMPDISRANSILNWYPKISLRQGLVNTMEEMQTRILKD